MPKTFRIAPILSIVLTLYGIVAAPGCSSAGRATTEERVEREREAEREAEEREAEEREAEEEREQNSKRMKPPMQWGTGLTAEPLEGRAASARFHIGSPLFVRLRASAREACSAFVGKPFFFDASGAQLGWGFEEVADSILFPARTGACERIMMLSSENSNRLAEGSYTFKALIFMDDGTKFYSDTMTLVAVRSETGADSLSYARFLQEQIVKNSPLLADPETVRALFADGTPRSAESEVYHALVLMRAGDFSGARRALTLAREWAGRRGLPLDTGAAAAYDAIDRALHAKTER